MALPVAGIVVAEVEAGGVVVFVEVAEDADGVVGGVVLLGKPDPERKGAGAGAMRLYWCGCAYGMSCSSTVGRE